MCLPCAATDRSLLDYIICFSRHWQFAMDFFVLYMLILPGFNLLSLYIFTAKYCDRSFCQASIWACGLNFSHSDRVILYMWLFRWTICSEASCRLCHWSVRHDRGLVQVSYINVLICIQPLQLLMLRLCLKSLTHNVKLWHSLCCRHKDCLKLCSL